VSANGAGRTYGSRFVAGYQMPRTSAATLTLGAPILAERVPGAWRMDVELCPLFGGRPDLWAVTCTWSNVATGEGGVAQLNLEGEQAARWSFGRALELLRARGGEPLDAIPAPRDAKLL
jgi:hypothetical protein